MIATDSAEFGLVLDDDLNLSQELAEILQSADWIPPATDIVRLETTGQWLRLGKSWKIKDRYIAALENSAWGAGAYIIRRSIAQKLVRTPFREHLPVDFMLFCPEKTPIARRMSTFQRCPALAVQDKFHSSHNGIFESEIETDHVNGASWMWPSAEK
jgi:glycosyl transferase family 25